MSDIPNTQNTQVAAIAAALEIAKVDRQKSDASDQGFEALLNRFLEAYEAIAKRVVP